MNKRKQLREIINSLEKERLDLINSPDIGKKAEYTGIAISDIEYKIACLEDKLDFENRVLPFKIMLYGFIAIATGIVTWACLRK